MFADGEGGTPACLAGTLARCSAFRLQMFFIARRGSRDKGNRFLLQTSAVEAMAERAAGGLRARAAAGAVRQIDAARCRLRAASPQVAP